MYKDQIFLKPTIVFLIMFLMNSVNGSLWILLPTGTYDQSLSYCNGVLTWGPCLPSVPVVKTGAVVTKTDHGATWTKLGCICMHDSSILSVDLKNKCASIVVPTREGQLTVSLDPMSSLIVHTSTLYEMNRQPGVRYYRMLEDTAAKKAVVPELLESLAAKRSNLSPTMSGLFHPAMRVVVERQLNVRYPDNETLHEAAAEPFRSAIVSMWNDFYREYWDANFERLLEEFCAMNEEVHWAEALELMEKLTGRAWKNDVYVFATEGTGKSALWVKPNICIGAAGKDSDAGFVHEGLHLLLLEEWAKSPQIREYMAAHPLRDPFWKENWAGKYEQALVVALDIHIRGLNRRYPEDKVVPAYFEGTGVKDLTNTVWPLVKAYVANPDGNIEKLMFLMIRQSVEQRPAVEEIIHLEE